MRRIVFILIFLIPFSTNGQDEETIERDKKTQNVSGSYIGAYLTPEFAYRTISNNDGSQTSQNLIDYRDEQESYKFGNTNGLTFGFLFNRKLGLETGVQYSNMGHQTQKEELVYGGTIDPRGGFNFAASGSPTHARLIDNFEYLGIPIALRYWSGTEKWRFSASLGCTASYLVRASSTVVLYYDDSNPERSNQTSETDYEKLNLIPSFSLGIDYQVNSKIHLSAMPTLRYGLLDIIDAPITGKLYSGGLQLGCYMNL